MRAATMHQLRRIHDEDDGFTLIELLTAIVIGTVIVAAGFGAATAAARLQDKTSNRVDAINRGRTGMEALMQAVRSQQCAFGTRPMLWASNTGMEFYGSATAINTKVPATSATSPGVVQPIQRIRLEWVQNSAADAAATKITNNANPTGDIFETVETQTNPGYSPMTFGQKVVRVLAEDVEQAVDRDSAKITRTTPASAIKLVPFFQYFSYQDAVGDGRIDLTSPIPMVVSAKDPLYNPAGLNSAAAADLSGIVLVQVNFRATPRHAASDGNSGVTSASAGVNFYNTISVRIADPSNPGGSPQCL